MICTIPADFCKDFARELIALSSFTAQPVSTIITSDDYGDVPITLHPEDIFELSQYHQEFQSSGGFGEMSVKIFSLQAGPYVVQFTQDDLRSIFFTVDKVLGGAESVPLFGNLEIFLGVLRPRKNTSIST